MAIFYLLPSRLFVGERFGDFLGNLIPGLSYTAADWPDLAENLVALQHHTDAHFVFGEDLPEGADVEAALMRDFGAEAQDEVYEVHAGQHPNDLVIHHWQVATGTAGERRRAA